MPQIIGPPTLGAAVVSVLAAYGYRLESQMSDPFLIAITILVGSAAVVVFWRFIFSAPREMEKEAVEDAEKQAYDDENLRIKREMLDLNRESIELQRQAVGIPQQQTPTIPPSVRKMTSDKPSLQPLMLGGNVFKPDNATGLSFTEVTGIALTAKIWNTGAPSVATDWTLEVIPKESNPISTQYCQMPPKLTLGAGTPTYIALHSKDSLAAKTDTKPIGETPIQGILLFYAPLGKDIVMSPDTRLRLIVKDIHGQPTAVEQLMGEWLSRS